MRIAISKGFRTRLKGRFGKYDFLVGVLQDGPHKDAKRGQRGLQGKDVLTTYAGGPIRKKARRDSGKTISQVSKELRERSGVNYLVAPFHVTSSAIMKLTQNIFMLAFGKSEPKRVENTLQAVVRNPMLRQDYGPNSPKTAKIKGFNRNMIDTAQLFKAIRATVKKVRR